MIKVRIAFALGSYLPRTYTWVFNQFRFFKDIQVLILSEKILPDRIYFPIENHILYSFPGFEQKKTINIIHRVFRRLLRFLLLDTRLDLFFFTRKIKSSGCILIHAHFSYMGWKFIPVARVLNIPLITSFYGYDYDQLPNIQPKWKKRYQELFKAGSLFLTEGDYGRKKLIEKGISPNKVIVHHLGVDVETIPFKKREKSINEKLRLVQVASFIEKKGHRILIEAMKILKDKNSIENISLTLIGDGPLKKEINELAGKYNLKDYVVFIDHIPYENLHRELLSYHVFIHPSMTTEDGDCEGGAPVVLLDAQATGMPVISTYHCDIPEEVIDGKTGILVKEKDYSALSEKIRFFIENPELIIQYGANGREHIKENYSAVKQAKILCDIYKQQTEDSKVWN